MTLGLESLLKFNVKGPRQQWQIIDWVQVYVDVSFELGKSRDQEELATLPVESAWLVSAKRCPRTFSDSLPDPSRKLSSSN